MTTASAPAWQESGPAGDRIAGLDANEYLRQSILDPDAYIVEGYRAGQMLPFYNERLSTDDLDALVLYLEPHRRHRRGRTNYRNSSGLGEDLLGAHPVLTEGDALADEVAVLVDGVRGGSLGDLSMAEAVVDHSTSSVLPRKRPTPSWMPPVTSHSML
ncbi:MAG: hypothetical protein R2710_17200 [Acidimicrobiales bacterium]